MHKNRRPSPLSMMVEYFIYFIGLFIISTSAFNVEHRYPVLKTGPKDSLFGLSIAQHHIIANSVDPKNSLLLVGAPTADRAPEHSKNSVKPGGLYKCEVSMDETCTRVIVDDKVSTFRANSSNQWLGVRVKSHKPGGKIAVCAHRYTIIGGARNSIVWEAGLGRCFLLENTVKPLRNELAFEWTPCLGKTDRNGRYTHELFGYCQAGTAVDFADVPKSTGGMEEFIIFGTPGSFFWSGALYASQSEQDPFSQYFWTRDVLGIDNPIRKNSLLGSSIASGVLLNFQTKAVNFVAGAPGFNVTGSVAIFEKKRQGFDERLVLMEIIHGDKIASRFGHEVQLIDVTGDGRLDLLVGAPQYYDPELGLGGAVYIYVNKGLGKIDSESPQKIHGKVDSSFGMSITSIGDVNMDGAEDIAIGAPGEDGWLGSIYIYHGNNQEGTIGVHDEPAQIIRASDLISSGYLTRNMTGMGYSVSGGLDMDFNGYPDIAAGSLSDSVIMFLTRPIVNIIGSIKVPKKKIIIGDIPEAEGYDVTVCLSYTSSPSTFDEEVQAMATIKLDIDRLDTDLPSRASFSSVDQSVAVKNINVKLYPQSQARDKCRTLKVYINKEFQDKLSPISVSMTFDTPNSSPARRKRATDVPAPMPIMNAAIENTVIAAIEFSKDCGDDEICKSELSMTASYEVSRGKNWEKIEKNEDGIPVLKLGTEDLIGMMINVSNPKGEDAHQAHLKMILPDVLDYRGFTPFNSVPDLRCQPDPDNKTLVTCDLGNPFLHDSVADFRVKLSKNKTSIYKSTGFNIQLQLHTTSFQPGHDVIKNYPVIVRVEAQLKIVGYASDNQIEFSGSIIGESAVKEPSDAGVMLTHIYEVENTGTGPADNVELNVKWPLTLSNGKWLFYLLKVEVDGKEGNCTLPEEVNPLGLVYRPNSRQRREADAAPLEDEEIVPKSSIKPPASAYEELICPETASCVQFPCSLGKIQDSSKVYVKLHAILWNSTFLEEYKGVSQIKVTSSASVSIAQENIKFSESSKLNDTVSIDILSEDITPPEVELKWWIIAVASLAGVILLVGIILLLWKCGFFKRRKFGDYQKARRHKQASKKADERETLY